jgi:membrane-associated phospholipid phosphatase
MPYIFIQQNCKTKYEGSWHPIAKEQRDGSHPWLGDLMARIVIAPPPSCGEGAEVNVVNELVALVQNDTARKQEIQAQDGTVKEDFEKVLCSTLTFESQLLWNALIDFAGYPIMKFKAQFNRARPYEIGAIGNLFKVDHPSYPSGHATYSYLLAFVFGEVYPKKKHELFTLATRIALNRELAGVHFKSDSAAGLQLARELYVLLDEVDGYRTLLQKAKAKA